MLSLPRGIRLVGLVLPSLPVVQARLLSCINKPGPVEICQECGDDFSDWDLSEINDDVDEFYASPHMNRSDKQENNIERFQKALKETYWPPNVYTHTPSDCPVWDLHHKKKVSSADLFESDDTYTIRIDMPGIEAGAIKLKVNDSMLSITGERKVETNVAEEEESLPTSWEELGAETFSRFHFRERSWHNVERTVQLPRDALAEKATADLQLGVLEIQIPRSHTPEFTIPFETS